MKATTNKNIPTDRLRHFGQDGSWVISQLCICGLCDGQGGRVNGFSTHG